MALPAEVDSLDSIEEHFRGEYAKDEESGTFRLQVTPVGGFSLENIDGLKKALGSTRSERDGLKTKLDAWGDLDPKAARDALADAEKFRTFDPKTEADKIAQEKLQTWQKQVNEEWEAKYSPVAEENSTLRSQNARLLLNRDAGTLMADMDANPHLIMPLIMERVKFKTDSIGELGYEIVDAQGNKRIGDQHGNDMTLEQLFNELRDNEHTAGAFNGSGQSGSGSPDRVTGDKIPANLKRSEMSDEEKVKFIAKHDLATFQKLPL